jgi:hypothetical protein
MAKLAFLSPKHAEIRARSQGAAHEELIDLLLVALHKYSTERKGLMLSVVDDDVTQLRQYIRRIIQADSKNYVDAPNFIEEHPYFFLKEPPAKVVFRAGTQSLSSIGQHPQYEHWSEDKVRSKMLEVLAAVTNSWDHDSLNKAMSEIINHFAAERQKVVETEKTSDGAHILMTKWIWQHLRGYVAWGYNGPSLIETMIILGPDLVLGRIREVEVSWSRKVRMVEHGELDVPLLFGT